MDIKFVKVLQLFFPKGKIWIFQENFTYLIDGISIEFGRIYDKAKQFYQDFNIIESDAFAVEHSNDYLITQGIYTDAELQRIIVEYLNKDLNFESIINDFASYVGMNLTYGSLPESFIVGSNTAGNALGDTAFDNTNMVLYVVFNDIDTQQDQENIIKIKDLIDYLKPPYIGVLYNDTDTFIEYTFEVLTV